MRRNGRTRAELRPVRLERRAAPFANGSCLAEFGRTRVLCTANIEETVPDWRAGRGLGWATAEYAMLPSSTPTRVRRERGTIKGRTQEIQRLVGRSLRGTLDFAVLGERTVILDCDVLVADGGTRTAAITGAAVALHDACSALLDDGRVGENPMQELVAAISVGLIDGEAHLDLDYSEDSTAAVDLNLVGLEQGGLVEIQGTGERGSFSRQELDRMLDHGEAGIAELFQLQKQALDG